MGDGVGGDGEDESSALSESGMKRHSKVKETRQRFSLAEIVTVIATLTLSGLWYVSEPGWEPLLSILMGIGAIAALQKAPRSSKLDAFLLLAITFVAIMGIVLTITVFATNNTRLILWLFGKSTSVFVLSLMAVAFILLASYVLFVLAPRKNKRPLRNSNIGRLTKYSETTIRTIAVVLICVSVILIVTINLGYRFWLERPSQETIVLVANFTDPEGTDSNQLTRTLVDTLNDNLDEELGIKVQYLGFEIDAATLEEQDALAEEVRDVAKASVIIWGDYVLEPSLELYVHFTTSLEWPEGFEVQDYRIFGDQQVEKASSFNPELPKMFAFKIELAEHFAQLITVLRALILVETQNYEAAQAAFDAALTIDSDVFDSRLKQTIYLYRGNNYLDIGKYSLALDDFTRFIELAPDNVHGYYNRGYAYTLQGDFDKAIKDYSMAITMNPRYIAAYNNRGNLYHQKGMHDDAIKDFEQTIKINPDFAYGYHNRGLVYADQGKTELAIEDMTKAISLDPNYETAYYNRGVFSSYIGNYRAAIEDYSRAIDITPEYRQAFMNRSLAHALAGNYQLAILDANRVINFDPASADAYYNLAHVYSHLEEYDSALENYQKALKLDPSFFEVVNDRGRLYRKLGRFEESVSDFTNYIQGNPNASKGYIERAATFIEMNESESATRDLLKALEIHDDDTPLAHFYLGKMYDDLDQCDKAVQYYTQYLESEPSDSNTYFLRGGCYWISQQYEAAIQDLDSAISIFTHESEGSPKSEILYITRAFIYRDSGQYSEAIVDFSNAIDADPSFGAAYYYRGLIFLEQGDYESAVSDIAEGLRLYPNDHYMYADLGKAHAGLGHRVRAFINLRLYLFHNPDAHDKSEIEQLISDL